MAFVVAVAQRKGGAGKSTVAANLAAALAVADRVALLDTDPQGTLTRWHALRPAGVPAMTFEAVSGWRVPAMVERMRRDHAFVVLDTPPHTDSDSRAAMRAADLVLIPLQPSMPDVWAMEGTLELAASERKPVALVLNRVPAQGRAAAEVRAALTRRDLPVLPGILGNRAAYAAAFGQGLGAAEHDPKGLAAVEARELAEAIRREAA